jgi:hypothetical protein
MFETLENLVRIALIPSQESVSRELVDVSTRMEIQCYGHAALPPKIVPSTERLVRNVGARLSRNGLEGLPMARCPAPSLS